MLRALICALVACGLIAASSASADPAQHTDRQNPGALANSASARTAPARAASRRSSSPSRRGVGSVPPGWRPPSPHARVTRRGHSAIIRYWFTRYPLDREHRPVKMIVTVDPAGLNHAPRSHAYWIRRRGTIRHPLPSLRGPFTIYLTAGSRALRLSKMRTYVIR